MKALILPWPPSVNRYWRHFRGRTIISKAGNDFRTKVQGIVFDHGVKRGMRGRLRVQIDLYPVDLRNLKMDVDNAMKAILDAIEASGVFFDDNQVDDLRVIRHRDHGRHEKSAVEVRIWPISAP